MLKSTPKVQFLLKELSLNELFVENNIDESMIDNILSKNFRPRLIKIAEHMRELSKAPIIPKE
jgi:hypothetical protein